MNWSQICEIKSGHFRVGELMIRCFSSGGLFRVEYFSRVSGKWHLWKLDEVHELLILQVLRDRIAKLKGEIHISNEKGEPEVEWKVANLKRLKRILDEVIERPKVNP